MLHYTSKGLRRYDHKPVYVHQRKYWEFQAVLSGEIALSFFDRESQVASQRLWLTDPQCAHGWRSHKSTDAEIVVFHFDHVPQLLEDKARTEGGVLSCDLSVVDIRQLRLLSEQAAEALVDGQSEYQKLLVQHINSDLSLRILRAYVEHTKNDANSAENIVDRALAWYEAQLHEGPSYKMMADAMFVSEAHLRRLFHQQLQCSPQKACESIRFKRACDMLQQGQAQHQQIADACGFSDASSFSRSFKRFTGKSPRTWKA